MSWKEKKCSTLTQQQLQQYIGEFDIEKRACHRNFFCKE
jgi:hypothetical protein